AGGAGEKGKKHFNPQLTLGNAQEGGYALAGGPWYPSNLIGDVFQATVRFQIDAPVELAATGQMQVHQPAAAGSVGGVGRFTFQTKSPVTGLYFVYGPFTRRQEVRGGITYTTLFRADHAPRSAAYVKAVADILDFYSTRFGAYSFEQLTIVDTPLPPFLGGVGPAGLMLLHQSMVGQNDIPTNLLAHELAHQWFGNQVPINMLSPGYSQWLSEGFATYADALYTEAREGPAALAHHMERYDQLYFTSLLLMPRMTSILGTPPGSPLYRPVVYEKGAIVLHSLRKVMGDERFFLLLKEYVKRYQNTPSTVDDFRKLAQEIHGQDLGWFFPTWLEKTSFAHYRIASVNPGTLAPAAGSTSSGGGVRIKIQQPEEVLKMPVDILLTDAAGHQLIWPNVWIDKAEQEVQQTCPFVPTRIVLDADNWILKRPGPDATWPPPATVPATTE
ncbi:MAG: M1 family aminopeptidase, partial [Phycisphaerae bacterium]